MVYCKWLSPAAGTVPFPFSIRNPESNWVTDSCGQEDPMSAAATRPLIISATPHTARPQWDDAAGTDGHLAAEH